MIVQEIRALSMIKSHHIELCLHVSLAGRYTRLPFRPATVGDMFPQNIDEIFKEFSKVFGIVDDIIIVGYDANNRDHDKALKRVM